MPESGWLMIKGMAAEVTFYKALFDKLGRQGRLDAGRQVQVRTASRSPGPR